MMERLGNVLYWTGCAAAAGFCALGVALPTYGVNERSEFLMIFGAAGAACWLVGRAARYILSNR